jgi:hypothetical protein
MEKNIEKELQIKFIGEDDWKKFRDFLILKLSECRNEGDMEKIFRGIIAGSFRSIKELDSARKLLLIEALSKKEKERLNKILQEAKKK